MYKLEVVNGRVGTMLKKPDGTKFHYELNKNVVQHMINNGELVPSDERQDPPGCYRGDAYIGYAVRLRSLFDKLHHRHRRSEYACDGTVSELRQICQ